MRQMRAGRQGGKAGHMDAIGPHNYVDTMRESCGPFQLASRNCSQSIQPRGEDAPVKTIPVSDMLTALVDDEDYPVLSRFRWYESHGYAATKVGGHDVRMHLLVLPSRPGYRADHRDQNPLNNQKDNLRYATMSQNAANTTKTNSAADTRGIYLCPSTGMWCARISVNRRPFHLGRYRSIAPARITYQLKSVDLQGDFSPYARDVDALVAEALALGIESFRQGRSGLKYLPHQVAKAAGITLPKEDNHVQKSPQT